MLLNEVLFLHIKIFNRMSSLSNRKDLILAYKFEHFLQNTLNITQNSLPPAMGDNSNQTNLHGN